MIQGEVVKSLNDYECLWASMTIKIIYAALIFAISTLCLSAGTADNGESYDGKLDANEIADLQATIEFSKKIKNESETNSFKPFDCKN